MNKKLIEQKKKYTNDYDPERLQNTEQTIYENENKEYWERQEKINSGNKNKSL